MSQLRKLFLKIKRFRFIKWKEHFWEHYKSPKNEGEGLILG